MICRIADFNIEFKNPSSKLQYYLKSYISNSPADFAIETSANDIETLRDNVKFDASEFQLESAAFHNKLLERLPFYDALFLHASLIEVGGIGVAFTALSGTGKSTHTLLWQELLGDKMQIINGDKPIIRFFDSVPYGYGTPWNGKEGLGTNTKVPIKHICFIERSENNNCEKIDAEKALKNIFSQIFIPNDALAATKTLELLNLLLNDCAIWKIKCNMDLEAAQIAYNTIFKEN
ncbi:MAG: hypothetical protein IKT44_03580 [Clostridia bacterium]|nr:hypothetical protein [Clostridia bacterium]